MKLMYAGVLLLLSAVAQAREYSVSVKGISAGKATLSIQQTEETYKVQLTLYPNMMAKMFDIDDMREVSEGTIIDGHAFPNHYKREELSGKQLLSVAFLNDKVNINKEGEKKHFSIEKMAQDPLSQVVQIQRDLKAGRVAWGYYTVTDRAQYYSIAKQKGRQIDLIRQKKKGSVVSLWFDKNYELTRMRKTSGGKVSFDMRQR